MPWRPLDHTADAAVLVTAGDREGLFVEALKAMTDTITEVARVGLEERRPVRLTADRIELLLVEWLGEALYRFEVEGFVSGDARLAIAERAGGVLALDGELLGEPHDPGRHPHKVAIKAITYHRLEVAASAAGWRARLIFDL